jgi:metal-sulfur cluster biosynthetic enzyme
MSAAVDGVDLTAVRDALREVIDPEIGIDIVSLGLVYALAAVERGVRVRYTLTTPGCPLSQYIATAIEAAAYTVAGVDRVELELVWEPRWTPERIEEGAL